MQSLNTCSRNKNAGFSLIEMVIAVAIVTGVLGLGLLMSMDVYRGYRYRSERDIIVSLLQKARSRAMANIDETTWGVCSLPPHYVVFRGIYSASAAEHEMVPANSTVTLTGFPLCGSGSEIIFDQLTGDLLPQLSPMTSEKVITVTQINSTTIAINNEGRINW